MATRSTAAPICCWRAAALPHCSRLSPIRTRGSRSSRRASSMRRLGVMRNPYVSADLRIKVALAAAPFVHAKLGNAPSRLRVTQGIETPPRREYSEIELARRVADLLERGSAAVDKAKADLAAGRISAEQFNQIMGNGD